MIGEQNEKKLVYINQPTYYIVREWGNEWKGKTTVVSGAYASKENALKECHRRNLELENSIKVGYAPDKVIGGKFKVITVTCVIKEEE